MDGGDKIALADDGGEQPVMGILIDEEASAFYFGFIATFEARTSGYTLQHASISVFHDIYAGDLAPFFRAEWDQRAAADSTSKHAQPHWHFVQSPERIGSLVRTLVSPKGEFSLEPEGDIFPGLADFGRFHFAMTSLLGGNEASGHKQLFDSSDFPKWFTNLTNYIAAQIAYIAAKAPSPPACEFVPSDN